MIAVGFLYDLFLEKIVCKNFRHDIKIVRLTLEKVCNDSHARICFKNSTHWKRNRNHLGRREIRRRFENDKCTREAASQAFSHPRVSILFKDLYHTGCRPNAHKHRLMSLHQRKFPSFGIFITITNRDKWA